MDNSLPEVIFSPEILSDSVGDILIFASMFLSSAFHDEVCARNISRKS
jgi:hypothetical protein